MLLEADRLEPKMRTPKSQRQSGGHREGKLMIGLGRVWGWEEGRDGGCHSACHVFQTSYPRSLTQGEV